MQSRAQAAAAAASISAVAAAAAACNERTVRLRADRLDRLRRDCDAHCGMARTSANEDKLAEFSVPIVVKGLIDTWPATRWSFSSIRERIGHALVDCGSSTGGVPFYLVAANAERRRGRADLALYVFDSDFSDESGKSSLLDDVGSLLALTALDVFADGEAAEHDGRPVWRWLLAGPEGSGTPLHQDPWGYSSWNASLVGSKRWVLFPPSTPARLLHPPRTDALARAAAAFGLRLPVGAAQFMDEVLPTLRGQGLGEVELVQLPGEVIAFPAGWWHAVVNLDATIAITESYGRPRDLPTILEKLRAGGLAEFAGVVARQAAGSVPELPQVESSCSGSSAAVRAVRV